jgi:hypothetical protein
VLDFIVKDVATATGMKRGVIVVPSATGTVRAQSESELELADAVDGIEATALVTISPWYGLLQNPVLETNFSLEHGEIRRSTVAVLDAEGEAVVLGDLGYDTFELKVYAGNTLLVTIPNADITISGNTFSFINTTAMTASKRVLSYKLFGNGGEAPEIHARIVEGRITVS